MRLDFLLLLLEILAEGAVVDDGRLFAKQLGDISFFTHNLFGVGKLAHPK